MRDQIDFEETGAVVVPVGEGADRGCPLGRMMLEERTGFGRCPATGQGGAARGGEQPISGRRAEGQEEHTHRGIEEHSLMPFHRLDQCGQTRNEPFATDAIRDFPELHEAAPQRDRISRRARPPNRFRARRRWMIEERQCVLTMVAGRRDELGEDPPFLRAGRRDVARRDDRQEFAFARHTHHCLVFLPCAQRRGMGKMYS